MTVIGTVTLDTGGSQDFTDTNSANFPQHFYRISETQRDGLGGGVLTSIRDTL
jgi:hypothetical protein